MVPPEIHHDMRICIEDLVDIDLDESDVDEWRDEREVLDDRADIQHAENVYTEAGGMRKRDHLQPYGSKRHPSHLNAIFRAFVWSPRKIQTERFSHLVSGHICVSKWTASNAPWNMRRRGLLLRVTSLMLTMSARGADMNGETLYQEPSKQRAWITRHVFAGGRQVHVDVTIGLSAPNTEVLTAEDWKQGLEKFEDENNCENSSDDSDGK